MAIGDDRRTLTLASSFARSSGAGVIATGPRVTVKGRTDGPAATSMPGGGKNEEGEDDRRRHIAMSSSVLCDWQALIIVSGEELEDCDDMIRGKGASLITPWFSL